MSIASMAIVLYGFLVWLFCFLPVISDVIRVPEHTVTVRGVSEVGTFSCEVSYISTKSRIAWYLSLVPVRRYLSCSPSMYFLVAGRMI